MVSELVEAGVPSGAVACGLAQLLERVDQRQLRARAVGLEREPQRVRAPAELHHRVRLVSEHLALHRRQRRVPVAEAKRRSGGELALDRGWKPRLEVLRFGERPPHLLGRVRQIADEPQPPAPASLFELAVPPCSTYFDQFGASGIVSRCPPSSSSWW